MTEQSPKFNEPWSQAPQGNKESIKQSSFSSNNQIEMMDENKMNLFNFESIDKLFESQDRNIVEKKQLPSIQPVKEQKSYNSSNIKEKNQNTQNLPKISIKYQTRFVNNNYPPTNNHQSPTQPQPLGVGVNNRILSPPQSTVWIQKIPYTKRVTSFEQRIIIVPIQKIETAFYEIEHITEYKVKQIEEIVYETEMRQYFQEKLQYIPVQQKVIHMPQNLLRQGRNLDKYLPFGKREVSNGIVDDRIRNMRSLSPIRNLQENIQINQQGKRTMQSYRNGNHRFVTTDNYNFELRKSQLNSLDSEIQSLKLSESQLLKR